jgi:hypothetical protein
MHSDIIKGELVEVLKEIQEASDLACPVLTGESRPVDSLPNFNSKVWAVATSLLAERIGATIPNDANIFFNKLTKKSLSIDETVNLVGELISTEHAIAAA